jgi:copper(I)-binding protein
LQKAEPKTFLTLGVLFAVGLPAHLTAAPAASTDIHVEQAWVRWLPADLPAAGYMTLTNVGNSRMVLIEVSSPDYGEVGIHRTQDDHGVSRMVAVASIALEAHSTVRFAEGGYHLMLMQPHRPVHPGDKVSITLHFDTGPALSVLCDVRTGGQTVTPR